jgi:hypothetical protein
VIFEPLLVKYTKNKRIQVFICPGKLYKMTSESTLLSVAVAKISFHLAPFSRLREKGWG